MWLDLLITIMAITGVVAWGVVFFIIFCIWMEQ